VIGLRENALQRQQFTLVASSENYNVGALGVKTISRSGGSMRELRMANATREIFSHDEEVVQKHRILGL